MAQNDASTGAPAHSSAGGTKEWGGWLAVTAVAFTDGGVAALLATPPRTILVGVFFVLAAAFGVAWVMVRTAVTGSGDGTGAPRRRDVRGVLERLAAPRPPRASGGARAWHVALAAALIVLAAQLYFAIARDVLGLDGVEQLGSLGDAFGPLGGLFGGLALFYSITASREQTRELVYQRELSRLQTDALLTLAQVQHRQAGEEELALRQRQKEKAADRLLTLAALRRDLARLRSERARGPDSPEAIRLEADIAELERLVGLAEQAVSGAVVPGDVTSPRV